MGRNCKICYHVFHHAWNPYLRLVNINYTISFTCSICKDNPDVVVFDGVTLGTIKNIPPAIIHIDTDQKLKCVPQSARLFIPSHVQRKRLTEYLQNGLSITAFRELVNNIVPNPLT